MAPAPPVVGANFQKLLLLFRQGSFETFARGEMRVVCRVWSVSCVTCIVSCDIIHV